MYIGNGYIVINKTNTAFVKFNYVNGNNYGVIKAYIGNEKYIYKKNGKIQVSPGQLPYTILEDGGYVVLNSDTNAEMYYYIHLDTIHDRC